MKTSRTYLFIAISSISLVIVLIIQVSWILKTAKIREELFKEKASMVLQKTAEALSADSEICKSLRISAGRNESHKVDSLFNHYMKLYNIYIAYHFEVKPGRPKACKATAFTYKDPACPPNCFQTCLNGDNEKNGLDLKLVFPDRKQYILAEMGPMFISSVILILVVLVLSWRTILSLMKEKKISEHTTDFLNNMTHEFKTPLTNIALAGKMILKDQNGRSEDKVKHYSGIILEENEKLRLQVEQVLSMTALERGEIPLQLTDLDLHQLIRDVIKSINIQIENKQGTLTLKLEAENSAVKGDKTHLTNALCNLVDNAVKYSRENPEITIRTTNLDQKIVVAVSDRGIGIDKAYQKKVFEKFFRVPTGDVHDVKGFGLGLAYTQWIVELHRGTIDLFSEKGTGTTFTITLPNG